MQEGSQEIASPCKGCLKNYTGNYCPNCGLQRVPPKINGAYLAGEVFSFLNFHKGLLYTLRELFYHPGQAVRGYITTDRTKLIKPLFLLMFCSLLYTLTDQQFQFDDKFVGINAEVSYLIKTFDWLNYNYALTNIYVAFFMGVILKLSFHRSGLNYFEILIFLFYILSIIIFIFTVSELIKTFTKADSLFIATIIELSYFAIAVATFFKPFRIMNLFKGLLAFILGWMLAIFTAIGVGYITEYYF